MNKRTLKALRGSIKKWEEIVAGKGIDEGSGNCPLCKLFVERTFDSTCAGCPVMKKTGQEGCEGSPYSKWADAGGHGMPPEEVTAQMRKYAAAEVKFLKSLLP